MGPRAIRRIEIVRPVSSRRARRAYPGPCSCNAHASKEVPDICFANSGMTRGGCGRGPNLSSRVIPDGAAVSGDPSRNASTEYVMRGDARWPVTGHDAPGHSVSAPRKRAFDFYIKLTGTRFTSIAGTSWLEQKLRNLHNSTRGVAFVEERSEHKRETRSLQDRCS